MLRFKDGLEIGLLVSESGVRHVGCYMWKCVNGKICVDCSKM
jgi:hypothetical protein